MNIAADLHAMIRLSAPFAGGLPTTATLPSGVVADVAVAVASEDDAIIHEMVIVGQTRKLTFVTAHAGGLKTQQNIVWNSQSWGVLTTDLVANGAGLACFLGSPF